MTIIDTIQTRRTIKAFRPDPIKEEEAEYLAGGCQLCSEPPDE